ncbi:adenosylhomocysteinase [Leucobacter luti]|uniref:adenosylhomocysteinase n=1 Tax=Leucobacter luti TaxID=340320 RepID=UPI003CFE9B24
MAEPGREIVLGVERALRAAARAGNRLLAAGTARVELSDGAAAGALWAALERAGVRRARPGAHADFVFVDRAEGPELTGGAEDEPGEPAELAEPRRAGLPTVVVDLAGRARSSRGADPESRIAWAAAGMPATAALAAQLRDAAEGGGAPRIAVSLVLEPKTAAFALALRDAGCEVAVFGAVSETDPEVAAALAARGIEVCAPRAELASDGAGAKLDAAHAAAVLDWNPELLIDDGAHLIRLAHTRREGFPPALRAAAEETTSGVRPLREMAASGELKIPVIAVNDARTKTGFDNLIGTGQSCVFAICDVREAAAGAAYAGVAGERWTVFGYGPVGVGVARFAAALGARVTVVERDTVRALAALHDGFEAASAEEALPGADVVVSATGVWHTITSSHFGLMRDGAAVAVAGGIDDELALDELARAGWLSAPRGAAADEWVAPGRARGPLVLAGGGGINYTAGEGNPVEVMDLSFATQLSALIRLRAGGLPPGVHVLSAAEERRVAAAALGALGGGLDPEPEETRPGGAAQPWRVHRYRAPGLESC